MERMCMPSTITYLISKRLKELCCKKIKENKYHYLLTLWEELYQSPTSRVNSSTGIGYGIGITDLDAILKPPKPPAALCIRVEGK